MPITHNYVTLASCNTDDLPNWSPIGDGAISNNTVEKKEGDAAINIYKPNTTTTVFGAEKSISSTDVRYKFLIVWILIKDKDILDKLTTLQIRLYDVNGNYAYFNIERKLGWQAFRRIANMPNGYSPSSPDYSQIVKLQIYFETESADITIPEGEIVMDYWHLGDEIIVEGYTWDTPGNIDDVVAFDEENALGIFEKGFGGKRYYIGAGRIRVLSDSYLAIYDRDLISLWDYGEMLRTDENSGLRVKNALIEGGHHMSGWAIIAMNSRTTLESVNVRWMSRRGKIVIGIYRPDMVYDSMFYSPDRVDFTTYGLGNVKSCATIAGSEVWCSSITILNPMIITDNLWLWRDNEIIGGRYGETIKFNKITMYYDNVIRDVEDLPKDMSGMISIWVTGSLKVQYSFKLRLVDHLGNPIPNARVILYDKDDNTVFDVTTDENGEIPEQIVTAVVYDKNGRTDYNPFRLYVEKDGVKQVEYKLEIYNPVRLTITAISIYNAYAWTSKPLYQREENVFIYFRPYDWNNRFISGLTVEAKIIKPDGSEVTITLQENTEERRYEARFLETQQIGTYFVTVGTNIGGNPVEAKTSFFVGKVETDIIRKVLTNNWEIKDNQLIIYDDDGVTPLLKFNLYDKLGQPTEMNVYKRVRVE